MAAGHVWSCGTRVETWPAVYRRHGINHAWKKEPARSVAFSSMVGAHRPRPPCTLLLFRHLQKTGGVSVRHMLHRLELSRDWRNYAEGTALHMEGSRRCSPRDEAQEAARLHLGAQLQPGCNRSFVLPLTLLKELAASCRAAAVAAATPAAAAATTAPLPPPPLRAMVELHTRGSYEEALSFAEAELRPAGWRVVSAVLLREPLRHLASWYLFDGRRSSRCAGGEQPLPRPRQLRRRRGGAATTVCTPAQYAEKRAARSPGGVQAWLLSSNGEHLAPQQACLHACVHAYARACIMCMPACVHLFAPAGARTTGGKQRAGLLVFIYTSPT